MEIQKILTQSKKIAVVGLSGDPSKDSYRVSKYMQQQGYRIIPVNPKYKKILGETSYPDLRSVPEKVDIVNVFRKSESIPSFIDDVIAIKPLVLWLQLGIFDQQSVEKAKKAGITVVSDKCIKVEHSRFIKWQ